jgi:signal transduction histidine kinase
MPTKVLVCVTPVSLAQLEYTLLYAGPELEVEAVTDGFRAVEVAARTQPAVVIVEIGLEGLSGPDLVQQLLATVPETSVICYTNAPSPLTAAQLLDAGASAYVLKEDGAEAVLRTIRSVLDGNVTLSHRIGGQLAERFVAEATQRRELEETLSEVSAQLETLTTAKADFLANISHELRTPVTVAKGIAYVLKNRGIPEEELDEFLGQLEGSLEKLTMLIDEMLTIADLDRGTLTLKLADVDLAPILRHVVDEATKQRSVAVDLDIPDRLPAAADPVRFAEIVRQLLDNACRYSPDDATVLVRARPMFEGVVVSVTDHGSGVQRDIVTKAFREPFTAGEDILRKERAGAGVGLHMARQLVLQHGGIMWADPLPAGGTRFSFVIPAQQGQTISAPPALEADAPSDPAPEPSIPARLDAGATAPTETSIPAIVEG